MENKEKLNIKKILEDNADTIVKELNRGKEIVIKNTPKGIKIQTLQISTIE